MNSTPQQTRRPNWVAEHLEPKTSVFSAIFFLLCAWSLHFYMSTEPVLQPLSKDQPGFVIWVAMITLIAFTGVAGFAWMAYYQARLGERQIALCLAAVPLYWSGWLLSAITDRFLPGRPFFVEAAVVLVFCAAATLALAAAAFPLYKRALKGA